MAGSTTFFDNGWNFFDEGWKTKGVCCWNQTRGVGKGALFSGDPVNSGEMKGRAAQMIDLNLAELKKMGIRYAVWNILCYSGIPFSGAEEVYAALQWGTDAQSGKLFEPSRCQLSFPLTGDSKTKYVCYIDLHTREMVYMDANLKGSTQSANQNSSTLQEVMPAYIEYLNSLPTVFDLFKDSVDETDGEVYITYSDKDVLIKDVPAFVFSPENEANTYQEVDLNAILAS